MKGTSHPPDYFIGLEDFLSFLRGEFGGGKKRLLGKETRLSYKKAVILEVTKWGEGNFSQWTDIR